eukprot:CAMPEP_0202908810 /NCGR_PEP_ID=MMETSP1392-20130828/47289_1 /ASSEMBLY_ACC=CAM_ASM_000868 /TAXON_ID=225041 /ORGANISM="Chlamydomonas chlamydogama, Strain SAG 11-48b" /LENGTH=92 /DNA_ID=CAMNT_0049598317 /DNA_START=444 /DNA_END=722 /DNA_ORIENTATION=+
MSRISHLLFAPQALGLPGPREDTYATSPACMVRAPLMPIMPCMGTSHGHLTWAFTLKPVMRAAVSMAVQRFAHSNNAHPLCAYSHQRMNQSP